MQRALGTGGGGARRERMKAGPRRDGALPSTLDKPRQGGTFSIEVAARGPGCQAILRVAPAEGRGRTAFSALPGGGSVSIRSRRRRAGDRLRASLWISLLVFGASAAGCQSAPAQPTEPSAGDARRGRAISRATPPSRICARSPRSDRASPARPGRRRRAPICAASSRSSACASKSDASRGRPDPTARRRSS